MHHQPQDINLKSLLYALNIGFISVIIIICLFYYTYKNEQILNSSFKSITKIEGELNDLLSNLQDAETGQRGYLLTSNDSYLEPYKSAVIENAVILESLEKDLIDNNAAIINLNEVTRLSKLKLAELALTIDYNKSGNSTEALRIVNTDIGKAFMDSIRMVIHDMRANQKNQLNHSIERIEKFYPFTNGIIIGALILICVILYSMYGIVRPLVIKIETNHHQLLANQSMIKSKNEQLEHFAYITSHDLREPLRTISSFIDIINKELKNSSNRRIKDSTKFIKESSDRMMVMIEGILSYSRIDSSKSIEQIDINEIIQEILDDLSNLIKDTKSKISFSDLPEVYGRRTEIRLLFQNLIANAIKFRKSETPPMISIFHADDKNYWTFKVSDNGIGISPKHKDKIFRFFTKLHLKTEYDGQGIGLAFCRKIVEGHGGTIEVESQLGTGSTFIFTISKNSIHDRPKT